MKAKPQKLAIVGIGAGLGAITGGALFGDIWLGFVGSPAAASIAVTFALLVDYRSALEASPE